MLREWDRKDETRGTGSAPIFAVSIFEFPVLEWMETAVTKIEPEDRLARALEALGQADFPAAISLLEELVVEDSANAHAWSQLGVCYLETQRPSDAVEALSRAVQAAPMDAHAHYLLGNACGSLGQLDRAAACYRRALELDPHHAKAEEFLMKVESLVESREHYRTGLSLLYSQNPSQDDLNRALRELILSVAIFENSPARDNLPEAARRLLDLQQERPLASGDHARAPALGRCLRARISMYSLQELGRRPGGL